MPVFNNILAGAAGSGGAADYEIERSLRFNSADSSYLSFQPSSAGNRRTWTWAGWVKRSGLTDTYPTIFGAGTGGNSEASIRFNSNSTIEFYMWTGGYNARLLTTQVFRDTSAWYHLVAVFDTTNATASNRIRLYINGSEVTTFSSRTDPGLNYEGYVNNSISHTIGDAAPGASPRFFNGYLADVHFIDGQALAPTNFGKYDDNGVWQPKAYSGSYGTNGFHLDFSDNSSSAALGTDSSGNSNTWTVNNLSVASGAGNDSLIDTPTNYEASPNNGGNYATWNPLEISAATLSNGNLDFTSTGVAGCRSTFAASSGKWYFEVTCLATGQGGSVGVMDYDGAFATGDPGNQSYGWNFTSVTFNSNFSKKHNNSVSTMSTPGALAVGDVFGVAYDLDSGKIWFSKNGTYGEGDPSAGTGASYTNLSGRVGPAAGNGNGIPAWALNAGQRSFSYTPPTGFLSLCTANLPDPTIADGSTAMQIATWTGNQASGSNSSRAISLSGDFNPDLVWIKRRSTAFNHLLNDRVRGFAVNKGLSSNTTDSESNTSSDFTYGFVSGTADGSFTVQSGIVDSYTNKLNETYVAWLWDAGTTTDTNNTAGSITPTGVRANASAGFSIVAYTGDGSGTDTIGHGLNAAPSWVITKSRGTTGSWRAFADVGGTWKLGNLNSTDAFVNASVSAPTSSVFSVDGNSNTSTTHIAYCFAPVEGYSAFGSYTGNGSADGPFVYTGFAPKWVLFKRTDTGGDSWTLFDTARDTNPLNVGLEPNSSAAEQTYGNRQIDTKANGFRVTSSGISSNASGGTFIYAAFAEHPFKTARAR